MVAGFAGWLYIDGADDRARSNLRREEVARVEAYQAARAQKAYIEPKEWWTEEELRQYDGTQGDGDGPILLSANGLVLNVWKGRHFYGPGCEYALFAGRDCTRFFIGQDAIGRRDGRGARQTIDDGGTSRIGRMDVDDGK